MERCQNAEDKAAKVSNLAMAVFELVQDDVRSLVEEVCDEKIQDLDIQIN